VYKNDDYLVMVHIIYSLYTSVINIREKAEESLTFSFLLKNLPRLLLMPFFFCAAATAAAVAGLMVACMCKCDDDNCPIGNPTPEKLFLCKLSWLLWREDNGEGGVPELSAPLLCCPCLLHGALI